MQVQKFTTRESWLAARQKGIGASESAALFGVQPESWGGAFELWARKSGIWAEEDQQTFAMWFGTAVEPVIRAAWEMETGEKLFQLSADGQFATVVNPEFPWLFCTPDALLDKAEDGLHVVQLKAISGASSREWRNAPPIYYQIQVQHEMMVCGATSGELAVLFGDNHGWRFERFEFRPAAAFQQKLKDVSRRFWEMVETGAAPEADGSDGTKSILSQMKLSEGAMVHLSPEWEAIDAERTAAFDAHKANEKRFQEINNRLRQVMGEAELALLDGVPLYRRVRAGSKGTRIVRCSTYEVDEE